VRLIAPDATVEEIVAEIGKLRSAKLLAGVRGSPPADIQALADIVSKVAALMRARPEIIEIDLNPVAVYAKEKGACALDVLVVIDAGCKRFHDRGCLISTSEYQQFTGEVRLVSPHRKRCRASHVKIIWLQSLRRLAARQSATYASRQG
jgi:hypothetical protein